MHSQVTEYVCPVARNVRYKSTWSVVALVLFCVGGGNSRVCFRSEASEAAPLDRLVNVRV